jgi:hypothetical protein
VSGLITMAVHHRSAFGDAIVAAMPERGWREARLAAHDGFAMQLSRAIVDDGLPAARVIRLGAPVQTAAAVAGTQRSPGTY